jgi:hypothetical protein
MSSLFYLLFCCYYLSWLPKETWRKQNIFVAKYFVYIYTCISIYIQMHVCVCVCAWMHGCSFVCMCLCDTFKNVLYNHIFVHVQCICFT